MWYVCMYVRIYIYIYIYIYRERERERERESEGPWWEEKPADIILNPLPNEVNVVSVLQEI
jgi:hypothetical protein